MAGEVALWERLALTSWEAHVAARYGLVRAELDAQEAWVATQGFSADVAEKIMRPWRQLVRDVGADMKRASEFDARARNR